LISDFFYEIEIEIEIEKNAALSIHVRRHASGRRALRKCDSLWQRRCKEINAVKLL